jgi:hypothetical protein
MIATQEYLSAVTALYKVVEIKKYNIKQDYSELQHLPLVSEINEEILKSININLFDTDDKESIAVYESFLTNAAAAAVLSGGNQFLIDDEIELEQAVEALTEANLSEIIIQPFTPFTSVTRIMGMLRIKSSDIKLLLTNAVSIEILRLTVSNNIFAAVNYTFRGVDIILLLVLSSRHKNKTFFVGDVYIFNSNNIRIKSPARLFLQALHKYGKPITLNGKTQFLFLNGPLSHSDEKSLSKEINAIIYGTREGLNYEFMFLDDFHKKEEDFKNKIFI